MFKVILSDTMFENKLNTVSGLQKRLQAVAPITTVNYDSNGSPLQLNSYVICVQ